MVLDDRVVIDLGHQLGVVSNGLVRHDDSLRVAVVEYLLAIPVFSPVMRCYEDIGVEQLGTEASRLLRGHPGREF
jgi:hypothetical protein